MAGLVIVGAGHCGVSAAHAAREAGFEGDITLIGDDPELPYERPLLSKWDGAEPRLRPVFSAEWYVENRIDLRRGTCVTAIDRTARDITLGTGERVPYGKLLLATGAVARHLPSEALPSVKPHYLRAHADARGLARRIGEGADVLIIGGGFIGLELAASLVPLKAFVHVIEAQERILARALPVDIARQVHDLHTARGVTIHTACAVTAITNGVARLSNGQSVRVENVVVGIGSAPVTDLAADAGLAVDDGIVVDALHRTQDPDVFAAGDCCSVPVPGAGRVRFESWTVAGDQGRCAGQAMVGAKPDPTPPPWFWSDQFDHSLQVVGLSSTAGQKTRRPMPEGGTMTIETNAEDHVTYAAAFAPGNAVGRDIKIIQKIMEAGIVVDPIALADPKTPLKTIFRQR